MPDISNISETKNKALKENYVPYDQRDSQNLKVWDYVKDIAPIVIIGKLSAVAGYFLGKSQEAKGLKVAGIAVTRGSGAYVLGTVGAVFGMFRHWKKKEGKHLGVAAISSDLGTVISAEQLEKETKKQAEIIEGIKTLQEMPPPIKSHVEDITSRREAMASSLGKA